MQTAIDQENQMPICGGCGCHESVGPSMQTYRGPYFCRLCCNYLDITGMIEG